MVGSHLIFDVHLQTFSVSSEHLNIPTIRFHIVLLAFSLCVPAKEIVR